MKKLLALLTTLFVSIFNNVGFTTMADRPYTGEGYYKVDEGEPPDYRDIYNYNPSMSGKSNCRTTNWSSGGIDVDYSDDEKNSQLAIGKYVEANTTDKVDNLDVKTITLKKHSYIIAPYDCTLLTSSNTSDGHTMELECTLGNNKYKIILKNMERWYCCNLRDMDVDASVSGNMLKYPWVHNSEEQQGKSFRRGNVLGVAIPNVTTATVVKVGVGGTKDCTWKTLYLNK